MVHASRLWAVMRGAVRWWAASKQAKNNMVGKRKAGGEEKGRGMGLGRKRP